MTGPPTKVDLRALKASVSLLDLLPPDANPKRVGRDQYKALCSFHAEKTPSMSVRIVDGEWRYHCFGCGADGDVLDYVQGTQRINFREALRTLGGDRFEALRMPPQRRRLSELVMVCEGPGCGRIAPIDRGDLAFIGQRHASWVVLPDGRTFCGTCSRRLVCGPMPRGYTPTETRQAFEARNEPLR